MKRKVFGYDKTLEYLQKGYAICSPPMGSDYMRIDGECATIRYDVLGKLIFNKLVKNGGMVDRWTNTYILKEER